MKHFTESRKASGCGSLCLFKGFCRHRPLRLLSLAAAAVLLFTGLFSTPSKAADKREVLLKNKEYFSALQEKIENARQSVFLTVFLFKTTKSRGNLPKKIVYSLIDAAKRGIEVTVLLEDGGNDEKLKTENRATAAMLKKGGVNVLFDSPSRVTHVKAAVIDKRHLFIGSHNLTQSALSKNNELSIYIDSTDLAGQVLKYFKGI